MLKIIYGDLEANNFIYDPNNHFDTFFEEEWMLDPIVKEMIQGVDKSELIAPYIIKSPFLGPIPPQYLSGGVKTLILMNTDDSHIYNATACGPNCAEWLLKIAEKKDIIIGLNYLMDFKEPFEIEILNDNTIVKTNHDLMQHAVKLIDKHVKYEELEV